MTESFFKAVFDYVKSNPNKSAIEISQATGIHAQTVQRHLSGRRNILYANVFLRTKITRKLPVHKDGQVRGGYLFLYSVNPDWSAVQNSKTPVTHHQKKFVRDPITAALFGSVS